MAMSPAAASTSMPLRKSAGLPRGLAIRGALLLLVGLIEGSLLLFAFRLPTLTSHDLTRILGVYLLADAAVAIFEAAGAASRREPRLALAGAAAMSLAAGLVVLLAAQPWRFHVFAIWAIVTGVLDAAQARGTSTRVPGRLTAAAVSVVYGLFAILGPIQDPARRLLLAAAFAIVAGGLRLGGALRSR